MRRMVINTQEGPIPCEIVRFSSRCMATTLDYDKQAISGCDGQVGEPLKTIRKYRHNEQGDLFGLYCQPEFEGIVRVGDTITYTHRSIEDIKFDDPNRE